MSATPADPYAGMSPTTREAVKVAEEALEAVQRTVTQRDWLNITQVLNHTRTEVITDGGLRLLALAWVKEKAAHGGASWDVLLDMTDEEILTLHGFPTSDEPAAEAPATEAPKAEDKPVEAGAGHELDAGA